MVRAKQHHNTLLPSTGVRNIYSGAPIISKHKTTSTYSIFTLPVPATKTLYF
jgi:hypothetical protein